MSNFGGRIGENSDKIGRLLWWLLDVLIGCMSRDYPSGGDFSELGRERRVYLCFSKKTKKI